MFISICLHLFLVKTAVLELYNVLSLIKYLQ